MSLTIGVYLALAVCFGVALMFALKARASAQKSAVVAASVFGSLSIALALLAVILEFFPNLILPSPADNERKYQEIAFKLLGQELVAKHPEAKIAVVVLPSSQDASTMATLKAKEKGLALGLANKASVRALPPVDVDLDAGSGNEVIDDPASAYTARKLDDIVDGNVLMDVILCFGGLPVDAAKMAYWRKARSGGNLPSLALVNAYPTGLKDAIKSGYVTAVLTRKPKVDPNDGFVPGDEQKALAKRYYLITKENVDQMAADHPELFGNKDYLGGVVTKPKRK